MPPPRCSKSISVRPSPMSLSTTVTSARAGSSGWSVTVNTSRSGSTTSRYSPFQLISRRSGPANMVAVQVPPSRTSIETEETGTSPCSPPYQSAKRSGSVHSRHRRSRGASKTRVMVIPGSVIGSQTLLPPVEALLPEATVTPEPVRGVPQPGGLQSRGAELRAAPARDQAGALQHLQVLRHRLHAHGERLGQLVHRRLALRQPREDLAASRIGERREGGAQLLGRHAALPQVYSTDRLITTRNEEERMGRIVVTEFVSLDGVMEDPGGAEDFKYGGWTFEIARGDEGDKFKLDETMGSEALLLGRTTYEGFADGWPKRDGEFADKFNNMPKYVVSSTLDDPEWTNTTVVEPGDLSGAVERIRSENDCDVVVHGSAQLSQALLDQDLVDEVRLMVFPVVLGKGKRFFGETSAKKPLQLADSKTVGAGV